MEKAHVRKVEHLERSGIAVANGLEFGCATNVERQLVVGIGTQVTILINHRHCEIKQVLTIGCKRRLVCLHHQMMRLASRTHHLLGCGLAVGIVGNHF